MSKRRKISADLHRWVQQQVLKWECTDEAAWALSERIILRVGAHYRKAWKESKP